MNKHNNLNTNMKPQAKKQHRVFKVIPEKKQQLVEEKDANNIRKVHDLINHSFSGLKNKICVVIGTKSAVLVRSGYSFVAVKVKV